MESNSVADRALLTTEERYQHLARLIVLKLAASWLEKQEWVETPYDGLNPVQDLLFQIRLTSNHIWEDFFANRENNISYDMAKLQKQILEMSDLSPELKEFFNSRLNLS